MKLPMHFPAGQRILRSLLALLFLSLAAATVSAQTFTTLHSFTGGNDGASPYAGLILSGDTLYGTAENGGSSGAGTVFGINTGGTGFTNLHSFTGGIGGADPEGRLVLSGNTLYGTTYLGGSVNGGTLFAVNTDSSSFTNLHSFVGYPNDGRTPIAGLILSGTALYGTTSGGGSKGVGAVFAINTDGTGYTNIYSFTESFGDIYATNNDGTDPEASLVLSGNILYGTAAFGGNFGHGTVFGINTGGTGFTNLHSFSTNSGGGKPSSALLLSGNTLYGAAAFGGSSFNGTVFKVNTDGTGFTNLHTFTAGFGYYPTVTNDDGANSYAELILSGNTLYGTALTGGSSGNGTVFAVNTDGTGFTTLHSFTALLSNTNSDGARPIAGLILSGNTLYGTTLSGGSSGNGTVFSLSLPPPPPQLTIIRSASNIVLSWPTNAAGFTLQSTTNLPSTDWSPVPESPSVVGDQFCVTNIPVGDTLFYRLRGN